MLQCIKARSYFFILFFCYLLSGAAILSFIPKGQLEILINKFHHPILDQLFQAVTFLGDGLFSVLVILYLFYRNIYFGIVATTCIISNALLTQGLKRLVFEESLRPVRYFDKTLNLYYIKGLEIYSNFSFPSGHTSGAFALFLLLAFLVRKSYLDVVFFMIALLVGISRMYLLQHFFIDTYFGTMIGTAVTLFVFVGLQYHTKLSTVSALNRPLIKT